MPQALLWHSHFDAYTSVIISANLLTVVVHMCCGNWWHVEPIAFCSFYCSLLCLHCSVTVCMMPYLDLLQFIVYFHFYYFLCSYLHLLVTNVLDVKLSCYAVKHTTFVVFRSVILIFYGIISDVLKVIIFFCSSHAHITSFHWLEAEMKQIW